MENSNCDRCRHFLSAIMDGEATFNEADFVRRHLATCADCREVQQAYHNLRAQLRLLSTPQPPASLKMAVMNRVNGHSPVYARRRPAAGFYPLLAPWQKGLFVTAALAVVFVAGFVASMLLRGQPFEVEGQPVANTTEQKVVVAFNRPVDRNYIMANAPTLFSIKDAQNNPLEIDFDKIVIEGNTVELPIKRDGMQLQENEKINVVVNAQIKDEKGATVTNPGLKAAVVSNQPTTARKTQPANNNAQAVITTPVPATHTPVPAIPTTTQPAATAPAHSPVPPTATVSPTLTITPTSTSHPATPPVSPSVQVTGTVSVSPAATVTQTVSATPTIPLPVTVTQIAVTTAATVTTVAPSPTTARPTNTPVATPTIPVTISTTTAPSTVPVTGTPVITATTPATPAPTTTPASGTPEPVTTSPEATPSTAVVECAVPVAATFKSAYPNAASRVGCPTASQNQAAFTYQVFQKGSMLYNQQTGRIYVFYNFGGWANYQASGPVAQSTPATTPGTVTPDPSGCSTTPRGSFGTLWDTNQAVQSALGCPQGQDISTSAGVVQNFSRGVMIYNPLASLPVSVVYADGGYQAFSNK
jgi:hypothetical protein